MKIISKFHDYYDSAMGYGIDPNLLYRREPTRHFIPDVNWIFDSVIIEGIDRHTHYDRVISRCALAFCGKVYAVTIERRNFEMGLLANQAQINLALGADEAAKIKTDARMGGRRSIWSKDDREYFDYERKSLLKLEAALQGMACDHAIFHLVGAPVFIAQRSMEPAPRGRVHGIEIITNPRIAGLGMPKHVDAFAAFQEISMFLGSALAVEDRAPKTVGDDRIIAASKGFDEQSFRALAPGTKKTNRRANRQRKRGDD